MVSGDEWNEYELEENECEDELTCPEGFSWDECCSCVYRGGIETCEFFCPFKREGSLYRWCYEEKVCNKILDDATRELEFEILEETTREKK